MAGQPPGENMRTDPTRWLDDHGDYLYRYALTRLGKPDVAEDLVQETFLAALRAHERFAGASSERTWLVAILKRKLVDYLRRRSREQPAIDISSTDDWVDRLFDDRGNWRKKPGRWPAEPGASLESSEFWQTFSDCLRRLPERMANAFVLREMEEWDSQEICKVLNISVNNLWVILHRARLALCRCLEVHWFGK